MTDRSIVGSFLVAPVPLIIYMLLEVYMVP